AHHLLRLEPLGDAWGSGPVLCDPVKHVGAVRGCDPPREPELAGVRCAALHQLGRDDADLLVGKGRQSLASAGYLVRYPEPGDRRRMNPRLAIGPHPWMEPLETFFARPMKRGRRKSMSIRKMISLHPDVHGHVNQPLGDAV